MGETMEVRMGSLVIDVTDPVQIGLLREYAFEPDAFELTEDDFPGETEGEARQAMLDAVTDVFFPRRASSSSSRRCSSTTPRSTRASCISLWRTAPAGR